MKRIGFLLAFVTAISLGCNDRRDIGANDRTGDDVVGTSGDHDVSLGDRNFAQDLAIANMAEVELGKMATERAANGESKKFGQMIIDDHTSAGNKLKTIASQHRIELPSQLDDKHRDLHDRLAKLQGADFDREYMAAMVDGHEDVIDRLESRIDQADRVQWRAAIADWLSGKKVEERGNMTYRPPRRSTKM